MSQDLEERVAEQFEKHQRLRVLFFFDPEEGERRPTAGTDTFGNGTPFDSA